MYTQGSASIAIKLWTAAIIMAASGVLLLGATVWQDPTSLPAIPPVTLASGAELSSAQAEQVGQDPPHYALVCCVIYSSCSAFSKETCPEGMTQVACPCQVP